MRYVMFVVNIFVGIIACIATLMALSERNWETAFTCTALGFYAILNLIALFYDV